MPLNRATRTPFVLIAKKKPTSTRPKGDGMTALHWAASHDDLELARILIQAGANAKATLASTRWVP